MGRAEKIAGIFIFFGEGLNAPETACLVAAMNARGFHTPGFPQRGGIEGPEV